MELIRKFKHALYEVTYVDGRLKTIEGLSDELPFEKFADQDLITIELPIFTTGIEAFNKKFLDGGFVEIIIPPVNQKIAMWCEAWKIFKLKDAPANLPFDAKYKVTKTEVGLLKNLDIAPELLKAYFTTALWWNRDLKSISNYSKHINEIKAIAAGANTGKANTSHKAEGNSSINNMAESLVRKRFNESPDHD